MLLLYTVTLSYHLHHPKARPRPVDAARVQLWVMWHVIAEKDRQGWAGAALQAYFLGYASV